MATNFAKDIEREIGALEAQRAAAQEQVESIDKKTKYLRGLQGLYAPTARREKEKSPQQTSAAPSPEELSEEPLAAVKTTPSDDAGMASGYGPSVMGEPPTIATTVMSVERPRGQAATSIPSEGPVRLPTEEQMRGGR